MVHIRTMLQINLMCIVNDSNFKIQVCSITFNWYKLREDKRRHTLYDYYYLPQLCLMDTAIGPACAAVG